ncbi:hypothetical protein Cme02nite_48970 [Catellatospora methionotrophica]|uniref:Type II toxin-antitoxin system PemK/MazF family toxin n=1 Tax=Catellatospora methionotrophica TaxID=121620 RepID=A0A8J3LDH2_9ACTN|nr:hypothetical protein [Catellatospora methionotrophica]GIG16565.1 hypothetical protein Cme02nite_48970 [Catellatospora methionotrophica]
MERGEVWWAWIDERRPVVLLSGGDEPELRAMQIVRPATAEEKRGFVVLSGEEAADSRLLRQFADPVDTGIRGVGIEVVIGAAEGLSFAGVIRVALARDDRIFCTWLTTLTAESLLERAGALSAAKLGQLANALCLARLE